MLAALLLPVSAADVALLNKAIYTLQSGVEIETTVGGFLIPSSDRRNVYRLTHLGACSCKGGISHGHCYHGKMIAIVEEAQLHTMPRCRWASGWRKPARRLRWSTSCSDAPH